MNTSPSSYSLYPTKYLGQVIRQDKPVHIFIPKHESGEFIESYDSHNECRVIQIDSLDQLDQYIITDFDGKWFQEHINNDKSHYTIKKSSKSNDIVILPLDMIDSDRDKFPRFVDFEKLIPMPNDPLGPISVQKNRYGRYNIIDGNHRFKYSLLKGYTKIPCIFK